MENAFLTLLSLNVAFCEQTLSTAYSDSISRKKSFMTKQLRCFFVAFGRNSHYARLFIRNKPSLICNNCEPKIWSTMATLYVIATPIGNLEDITLRVLNVLKNEVQHVFCEDTRVSGRLLSHYGIKLPTSSLHAHSGEIRYDKAITMLEVGKTIAYMTDCGTPGISDPGSRLVDQALKSGFTVSPLPGASAMSALLSCCGFYGKRVIFAGFLSKKPGRRIHELEELKLFDGIIVVYESPHRILKTLDAIAQVFPKNQIAIGREMTKMFEQIVRGEAQDFNEANLPQKGEFSIAIDNNL